VFHLRIDQKSQLITCRARQRQRSSDKWSDVLRVPKCSSGCRTWAMSRSWKQKRLAVRGVQTSWFHWVLWRRGPESNRPTRICNRPHPL